MLHVVGKQGNLWCRRVKFTHSSICSAVRGVHGSKIGSRSQEAYRIRRVLCNSLYSELVKGGSGCQGGARVSLEIKISDNPFSTINPQSVSTSIDCLLIYCKSIDELLSIEGESEEC